MNFFEAIGVVGTIIIIGLAILVISLIKAIFEIKNHAEHIDEVISEIAKKQYGIDTNKP